MSNFESNKDGAYAHSACGSGHFRQTTNHIAILNVLVAAELITSGARKKSDVETTKEGESRVSSVTFDSMIYRVMMRYGVSTSDKCLVLNSRCES